jgi:8-oxo-dGTP diphosphatase
MEIWDILDSNRNLTGKTVVRGNPLKADEYHLVVNVWIRNCNDEYLISKRAQNIPFPNLWATTGGSAVSGDDSLTTALKETYEEIGILLDPIKGRIIHQSKRNKKDHSDFLDVWLFNQDFNIKSTKLQIEEVSDVKWANKIEIYDLLKNDEFFKEYDYLDSVFNNK